MEPTTQWWHRWRGEPEGSGNGFLTITLGPTVMGPDDLGHDGLGIPIRLRTLPLQMLTKVDGPPCVYVGSYTSEPNDDDDDDDDDE